MFLKFNLICMSVLFLSSCYIVPKKVELPDKYNQYGHNENQIKYFDARKPTKPLKTTKKEQDTPDNLYRFYKGPKTIEYAEPENKIISNSQDNAKKDIELSIDALPIAAFIQEIYGEILKVDYEIDSRLKNKKDLVTLRVGEAKSKSEIASLAKQVLANYGITPQWQGNLIRFVAGSKKKADLNDLPLLITGETLPEVPSEHRTIFQVVDLKVLRNTRVAGWVKQIYADFDLKVKEDAFRNSLILVGNKKLVTQAAKTVKAFDRPLMRGRYSEIIKPFNIPVTDLSDELKTILGSQGYAVATAANGFGPIVLLPVESRNMLLVFVSDKKLLSYIRRWVRTLDVPQVQVAMNEADKEQNVTHIYKVKRTNAEKMGELVEELLSAGVGKIEADISQKVTKKNAKKGSKKDDPIKQSRTAPSKGRVVVDMRSNSIIFHGNNEQWHSILPILRDLDVETKQLLIEVTVAEVTLSDTENFGIEWLAVNAGLGGYDGVLSTLGGLGVGSAGLSYSLNSAGQTRAIMNALSTNQRVNVLNSPKIMVRSGSSATIEVGNEIPVLTSQSTADQGTTAILQEVQYRKTGVILKIEPVVYGDNKIDINVVQEVSTAAINSTSSINSPVILNRSLSTSLTLSDGGSALLGGIVIRSSSDGGSGVPGLQDIPVIGALFKSEKRSVERTELIMQIIPYIVSSGEELENITREVYNNMSLLDIGDNSTKKTHKSTIKIDDIAVQQPLNDSL